LPRANPGCALTADDLERPDPEALLKQAQAEERRKRRGELRIFLGLAAGVGKTYTTLEAAREQLAAGRDVVVAYVETHGRAETAALLAGLPVIPRRRLDYRGVALDEMDLDAVLSRRPGLAIVDELAHTNAPGSRHTRRFQDVEELLDAGIDVYTTLNIQHVESLNDVVAQITGIVVRETVPDRVLEEADEVILIDLPPDELIQRLHEGKVYVPDQATHAIEKFFRPGNLTALRELSLRYLAQRVDRQMRTYMGAHGIPGPWPAGERVLVCLGPGPLAEHLVRAGRRLAASLDAEWIALFIETPDHSRLSESEREHIARALHLAEELGARAETLTGISPPQEIVRYARAHNVTKILAGASLRPRWERLLRGSLVEWIIRHSENMDVYIISTPVGTPRPVATSQDQHPASLWPYLVSTSIVALVTILGFLIHGRLEPTNLTMLFLLAVVIVALQWGRGPAILAAALSVAAFDFFFVPPRFTMAVSDTQYLLTFAGLLVVGLVISALASRVREQVRAAHEREASTAALYALSRDLAAASGVPGIPEAVARHVTSVFGRHVAIFLPVGDTLDVAFQSGDFPLDTNERAVATWVFQHGEPAGRGTETLPGSSARYLPLKTAQGIRGVLGVRPADPGDPALSPEQRRLLEAFASQAALAIERAQLAAEARHVQVLQETERLQTALLNSISHDLRTPLASITGALSSLAQDGGSMDEPSRRELLDTAKDGAVRLNRLVGDLLDMTRLEGGALRLRKEPSDVQDLIGTALTQLGETISGRPIEIDIPPGLPFVPLDFVLISRVLVNLLDNAVKYSPPDSPITIRARAVGPNLEIEVADRGPGIPESDIPRLFDMFSRGRRSAHGGVGLGLAICRGFVEAHAGEIRAENRPEGGLGIAFTIPLNGEGPRQSGGADERAGSSHPGNR
jgi:two-component system sensor histidine kinase KdpD